MVIQVGGGRAGSSGAVRPSLRAHFLVPGSWAAESLTHTPEGIKGTLSQKQTTPPGPRVGQRRVHPASRPPGGIRGLGHCFRVPQIIPPTLRPTFTTSAVASLAVCGAAHTRPGCGQPGRVWAAPLPDADGSPAGGIRSQNREPSGGWGTGSPLRARRPLQPSSIGPALSQAWGPPLSLPQGECAA